MKTNFLKMKLITVLLIVGTILFSACKKEDKPEENQEEVITTVTLRFVPVGGGSPIDFSYDDPDGPGGNAPTQQTITLQPNKVYNVSLTVLNKTTNPVTNITDEIAAEADSHRFYFEPSVNSKITVSNLNNDANGVPLGLTNTWTTTTAANGSVKVTLRHYPNTPPNKEAGDLVDSPKSSTDIAIEFNTAVL